MGYRILLTLLLLAVNGSALAASVKELRLWRAPDHTRVVLDLSGPVAHQLLPLENPDRLVIDLSDARLAGDLASADLSGTPIRAIRHAVKDKSDLRIVLDLQGSVKPRSFLLPKTAQADDRLVIDLYDRESEARVVKHIEQVNTQRDVVIAIDAGHGGEDPGALGPGGLREKNVVMAIAKDLAAELNKRKGFKAVLIRTGDYYVGLSERRELARKAQADLLVSIHADAFTDPRAYGTSIYALSRRGATSTTARFLAEAANSSDLVGGVSLNGHDETVAGVLMDLSMTASLDASMQVGGKILHSMGRISRLHSKRVEQAAFVVLKSPDMPSVLVETGFISNPGEAKKLSTRGYQQQMARAIFDGINTYFSKTPPPDTYLAWLKQNRQDRREYVIARGDTLSGIAQRYQVSLSSLVQENGLQDSMIRIGQTIVIPSS